MKKVILVDGNNLMFRSYYATLYSGSMMTNSEGFPTNALYGFVNMMNKIISEENPEYIMVAFDIGKTFRHEKYDYYKGKRDETPEDLKKQFPVAKKILNAMGIKYFELFTNLSLLDLTYAPWNHLYHSTRRNIKITKEKN